MGIEGRAEVGGPTVDRLNRIQGVQAEIVMMRTPDGHGRVELTKFRNPELIEIQPAVAPPNARGLRSVMFAVDGLDEAVERLRREVGEVVQYEEAYKLCCMRGPGGIIVALAEELSAR